MIAWFLVLELRALVSLLKTGEYQWEQPPAPASAGAIAAEYEKAADEMEQALAATDEGRWDEEGRMYYNGKLMLQRAISETIWDFFFDAIHHRGQLTAYLRPMGGNDTEASPLQRARAAAARRKCGVGHRRHDGIEDQSGGALDVQAATTTDAISTAIRRLKAISNHGRNREGWAPSRHGSPGFEPG